MKNFRDRMKEKIGQRLNSDLYSFLGFDFSKRRPNIFHGSRKEIAEDVSYRHDYQLQHKVLRILKVDLVLGSNTELK